MKYSVIVIFCSLSIGTSGLFAQSVYDGCEKNKGRIVYVDSSGAKVVAHCKNGSPHGKFKVFEHGAWWASTKGQYFEGKRCGKWIYHRHRPFGRPGSWAIYHKDGTHELNTWTPKNQRR